MTSYGMPVLSLAKEISSALFDGGAFWLWEISKIYP